MEHTKNIILSIILLLTPPTFAEVQPIKQGNPAPYDGFIFDKSAEKLASEARDDAAYYHVLSDKLQERSKLQQDENVILEQRLKLYMDATSSLSKEVSGRDATENYIRIVYLIVGVVGTSLVARNFRP